MQKYKKIIIPIIVLTVAYIGGKFLGYKAYDVLPKENIVADCPNAGSFSIRGSYLKENGLNEFNCSYNIGKDTKILISLSEKDFVIKNLEGNDLYRTDFEYYEEDNEYLNSNFNFTLEEDINFDGFQDLFTSEMYAYNSGNSYYMYSPSTGEFELAVEGTNLNFDVEAKEITSYHKGRGIGDIYVIEEYKFQDGGYVLNKVVHQDIVDYNKETSDYIYTVKELKDGKMVETERSILKYEDVFEQ